MLFVCAKILSMATTALQHAIESLGQLPAPVQDDLARRLMPFAAQWQKLQDGITEARDDIEHGRVTEVASVEGFIDTLRKEHGGA